MVMSSRFSGTWVRGLTRISLSRVLQVRLGMLLKSLFSFDGLKELEQGLFRRIPPEDKIDKGILAEDLFVKIGGREPTQDDRSLGMKPFDDLRQGQCSLDVGHPVKIDAEGDGILFSDESLHIEPFDP